MSTNYKQLLRPPKWVSQHSRNDYKYRLPQTTAVSGYNNGGYLQINLSAAFAFPLSVGDRIYLTIGDLKGFHIIRQVHSSIQYTLETLFTVGFIGTVTVWEVKLPEVTIYKGYKAGELIVATDEGNIDMYDFDPYTKVASFYPEPSTDGYIYFNTHGYIKTAVETPYRGMAWNEYEPKNIYSIFFGAGSLYPRVFNRIQIFIEGNKECEHMVAPASITTHELNQKYVQTGNPMVPVPYRLINAPIYSYIFDDLILNF